MVNKKGVNKNIQKEQEKSSVLSIIIALIVVALISWFIYDKLLSVNEPVIKNTNNNTNFIMSDEDAETLGKEKFNWLINQKNSITGEYIFFKDKKVTYNDIDSKDVLTIAYRLTETNDRQTNKSDEYNEIFNKNILKEQIDNYFTSDLKVNYVDFYPTGSYLCTLNNNDYYCKSSITDLEKNLIYNIGGFLSAKVYNDNLFVYTTILSVKKQLDIYSEEEQGVYSYLDLDKKIDDLKIFNQYKDNMTRENMELLIKQYKNQLPVYKSTFKLEKKNYVWVSTELEK